MIYFYFSILELSGSSSSTVSMQSLRLLINLSTNQHMIEYLQSAEVSLDFPIRGLLLPNVAEQYLLSPIVKKC